MSISEPSKFITPWAESGLKNPIPSSANPVTGRAGFDQGFSAINMTPKESGGIPPFGQDFNGIFFDITSVLRYMQAGGRPTFSTELAGTIGGYPKGAVVMGDDGMATYQNSIDSNASNPNSGGGGWVRIDPYALTQQSGWLTPSASWADVPSYSDPNFSEPLNAQAEALAARTELLRIDLHEALRRICAEAGTNLVDGSFELSGNVSGEDDVLLFEEEGKVYSWGGALPKSVPINSTPYSTGGIIPGAWTDRSEELIRSQLAASNGVSMVGGAASVTYVDSKVGSVFEDDKYQSAPSSNLLAFGRVYARNNVVLVGDSITAGVGTSVAKFSMAAVLGQTLANYYQDGYGYPVHKNTLNAQDIYSHNGTTGTIGLAASSVTLAGPGQKITLGSCEAVGVCGFVEVAQGTATSAILTVNGVTVATQALSGTRMDLALFLPASKQWTAADTVCVTCPSGTLVMTGLAPLKYANKQIYGVNTSPLVITCGKSGASFDYYRANKSELAGLASFVTGVSPSVFILALGTNSIYNEGTAQTPSEYVASMTGLYNDLIAINPGIQVIFTVPIRANEALFPVIKPGFTYQDYVVAIRAAVPDGQLIDLSKIQPALNDGVHPNSVGHITMARRFADSLGVPFNPELPTLNRTVVLLGQAPAVVTGGYAMVDKHGVKRLVGEVANNGSTSLLSAVSNRYLPMADRFFVVPVFGEVDSGTGVIRINADNGQITMISASIPWIKTYLDGISYI